MALEPADLEPMARARQATGAVRDVENRDRPGGEGRTYLGAVRVLLGRLTDVKWPDAHDKDSLLSSPLVAGRLSA